MNQGCIIQEEDEIDSVRYETDVDGRVVTIHGGREIQLVVAFVGLTGTQTDPAFAFLLERAIRIF
jgi:hypothetical protein